MESTAGVSRHSAFLSISHAVSIEVWSSVKGVPGILAERWSGEAKRFAAERRWSGEAFGYLKVSNKYYILWYWCTVALGSCQKYIVRDRAHAQAPC